MKKILYSIIVSLTFLSTPVFAVTYVSSPPLKQTVNQSVQGCSSQSTLQLPLITWGGDIATVLANGNSLETQSGSLFDQQGLKVKLKREDVFAEQVKAYLKCESPFLRGTMGMIHMASEVANKDPRTELKVIYQLTWSAGGDALVVKSGIKSPKDLKGKTVAIQAYGPHVDYLGKVLADAGLSYKDINVKWTQDLTGTDNTPVNALRESGVDAALVIIPDALALTSNGNVGTGAEDSVKGARILLSTKSANRIIADVYAVRSDYFEKNQDQVGKLVHALMLGEEKLRDLVKNKKSQGPAYQKLMSAAAKALLDSSQAIADTEGMYADAQFVGWQGNKDFFTNASFPRRLEVLNQEIQTTLKSAQLISQSTSVAQANLDYSQLKSGIVNVLGSNQTKFNPEAVTQVISKRNQQGNLGEGTLFQFEVFFKPNQNTFSADIYAKDFKEVINLAATYGGAVITVEGHSDPLGYLKKQKEGASNLVLSRIKQAAKNLSLTRANAVRDSLVDYAKRQGVSLDAGQFAVVGQGIAQPKSGLCGSEPCAPKTKQEWLDNMRVEFRLIQIEAEESVFEPL